MELACELWAAGIRTEFVFALSPNMKRQLEYANKGGIPWMVIFGSEEMEQGTLKVRDLVNRKEETVKRADLVAELQKRLGAKLKESKGVSLKCRQHVVEPGGCWDCGSGGECSQLKAI